MGARARWTLAGIGLTLLLAGTVGFAVLFLTGSEAGHNSSEGRRAMQAIGRGLPPAFRDSLTNAAPPREGILREGTNLLYAIEEALRTTEKPADRNPERRTDLAPDIPALRDLLTALESLAAHEDLRGETARALSVRLTAIQAAQATGRGALIPHYLAATALERFALGNLEHSAPQLDAPGCERALKAVTEMGASREPATQVARRDRHWMLFGQPWWNSWSDTKALVKSLRHPVPLTFAEAKVVAGQNRASLAIAIRSFQLARGRIPTNAVELVPEFLPASTVEALSRLPQ